MLLRSYVSYIFYLPMELVPISEMNHCPCRDFLNRYGLYGPFSDPVNIYMVNDM